MSDNIYSAIHQQQILLDVVDDEWMADTLSDDGKQPIICFHIVENNHENGL